MLYGDSFVYMSVLLDSGHGKIYNGKVNVLLHNESRTDFRLCGSGWCRTKIQHKNYFNPPILSTGPLYYTVYAKKFQDDNELYYGIVAMHKCND